MAQKSPRLELPVPEWFPTRDGARLPCIRVAAAKLADLEGVTRPYREGFHVAVVLDALPASDRAAALLLLAKVTRTDDGEPMKVNDGLALLVHPWRIPPPTDGPPAGVREPRSPSHPSDAGALAADLPK